MNKHYLHHSVYSLLFTFLFLTSCNGQVRTGLRKDNGNELKTSTTWEAKLIIHNGPNQYNGVNCGLQDRAGNLWFNANGEGVYLYDAKSFTNFTEKDGLNNNNVTSILEDKTGKIWFGTTAGPCRYDEKIFTNFSE